MKVEDRILRRKRRRILKRLSGFGILLGVGTGLYFFFFSGTFNIAEVKISGAETLDPKEVEETTKAFLQGRASLIFPKNNRVFLNERLLTASLLEKYPRISKADMVYRSNTLEISIQERKPVAFWCTSTQLSTGSPECLLVDEAGVIYEEVSKSGSGVVLKIQDETDRNLRKGMGVISEETMELMLALRENLRPQVFVTQFVVEEESLGANYLRADTETGWSIYVDTLQKVEVAVSNIKNLLRHEIGSNVNRLEYIDLRIPGRAYYKLR